MSAGGRLHVGCTLRPSLGALTFGALVSAGVSLVAVAAVGLGGMGQSGGFGCRWSGHRLADAQHRCHRQPRARLRGELGRPAESLGVRLGCARPRGRVGALATLGNTISTYERQWQANGGLNQVQDLVVRFPSPTGAQVFLQAAQHSLETGEIVSKGPLASIPGARLVTYFATTNESGVGEAITMRDGTYVALLSFFSAATDNSQPITPADAEKVALAQHQSLVSAPGGTDATVPARENHNSVSSAALAPTKKRLSSGDIAWAVVAVVIIAAAVATPLWKHRRRQRGGGVPRGEPAGPVAPL